MNQNNPSSSRRSILSQSWTRFTKAGALAVILTAAAAPLMHATGLVIDTALLTIAPTGILDLKDNALIVRSPVGGLGDPMFVPGTGYLSTGLNLAGAPPGSPTNAWLDGYGINSSVASLDGGDGTGTLLHGIGGIINTFDASLGGTEVFVTFQGFAVAPVDGLAIYTCMGDADLDGFITAFDQFLLDNSIGNGGLPGWLNGDFDYDGGITAFDQFFIDNSIGNGCVPPPSLAAGAVAAVPEPSAAALLMFGMLGIAGRRQNRRNTKK